MSASSPLSMPLNLRLASGGFIVLWCLMAAFPFFWITVMSFKIPIDAFASNPLNVIFGPATSALGKGLSIIDVILGLLVLWAAYRTAVTKLPHIVQQMSPGGRIWLSWIFVGLGYGIALAIVLAGILPLVTSILNPALGFLGKPLLGLTTEHYQAVWIKDNFYRNFLNSMLITTGVVTISLSVGTLAGYGLARSGSTLAFWLLVMALIFRALPHSVLVTGYLPAFIQSA